MAEMATASINDLPDSDFAYVEPGGTKDSSGKTVPRSLRHFPIHDAAHVRNALARAPQSPFGDKAMPKIKAAAKKFGIGGDDDQRSEANALIYMRSDTAAPPLAYTRSFELTDIQPVADGRTVEAYAAVFNVESPPIHDADGSYIETLDPGCFDRAIERFQRSKVPVPVLFNHGMTLFHTPDPQGGVPIGVAEEIRADRKGLFTRSKFHTTARADEVLEAIKGGSIRSYSFSGAFHRSDPAVPIGGFRRKGGTLPTVRRTESTLREYGPATFAVYSDAEIVGVRAEQMLGLLNTMAVDERQRLGELLLRSDPGELAEIGTSDEELELVSGDLPTDGHSVRSPKEEAQARMAAFIVRHGGKHYD